MAEKQKTRFRLLPYQILARRWMIPAILLIPAGFGIWWSAGQIENFNPAYADLGWIISIAGGLFTLRPPIHPMAISFKRIKLVHPIEFRLLFPQKNVKRLHYRLYHKLWGLTVPVVLLEGLPFPRWWLKLWFHPFLIHPDQDGIILVVKDWMGCSRALDTLRADVTKTPWQSIR